MQVAFILLFFTAVAGVHAQDTEKTVTGIVQDGNGQALSGVSVTSINGKNKAVSDKQGKFSLFIDDYSNSVEFSLSGYRSQTQTVEDNENEVTVNLPRAEAYRLGETVYLGLSSLKRGDVSGSVATVSGEELERSPVSNLSQALAGRLPGLYTCESYSEPSRSAATLRIRGANSIRANTPLVVIDGIPYIYNTSDLFENITGMEIESISILKDAASQALYGIMGANGVVVITTKRGVQKKLTVDVKIDQTFEQPTTRLPFINSGEFVQLRNEAGYNDGLGQYAYFSEQDVAGFVSGANRELYPNNDWRKINMKDLTSMQRVGVNLTGGNKNVLYFTNLNVLQQEGLWKTYQTKYDPNNNTFRANFHSNVDAKLNRLLKASLNLSGNILSEKTPGGGYASSLYPKLYSVPSWVYGPVADIADPVTGELTKDGVVVTPNEDNPAYPAINRSGYVQHTITSVYAQFNMILDMAFITEGLNFTGGMAYQTHSSNDLSALQQFARWTRTGSNDQLIFSPYGTAVNTPLAYSKTSSFYYNMTYKGLLDYKRRFGKHDVSAIAFASYQNLIAEELPYMRINSGIGANYGYDNRYLLAYSFSYSGSEQYSPQKRFTPVQAVSAGWVLSNESFMNTIECLDLLKIRASYGQTANDQSGLERYSYLDNINLSGSYAVEGQIANPELTPEISVKQNYGFDLTLFDRLSLSADIFREKMDNMVCGGAAMIPAYQGVPLAYYPKINKGIFENKGYEITADYTQVLSQDISFNLGGWLARSENKVIYNGESERAGDYAYRKWEEGFPVGQEFGYLVDMHNGNGYFNSQSELEASNLTYEIGTPRVGDLIYCDLNADNIINEKDKAPLGHGIIPRYVYAFHAGARYKNFELNVMFQGVEGLYSINGFEEYAYDGLYGTLQKTAWTAERFASGGKITYPALAVKANANHNSNSFFLEDRSYLRLKNVEFAYTFPEKPTKAIKAEQIRLTLSGQNLLTRHRLKSDDYGPEGNFLSIPVYRFYNIGLNIKF